MKIAFDEHVPAALVRTFQTLAEDKAFRRLFNNVKVVSSKDYNPSPRDLDYVKGRGSDAPWIRRFRKDGGKIILSGNTKMPSVPQELLAIQDCRISVFFFPNQWNSWRFSRKSALIFAWLERILAQAKKAKRGAMYRIPNDWSETASLIGVPAPTPLKLPEIEQPVSAASPRAPKRSNTRGSRRTREEPALLEYLRRSKNAGTD